MRLLIFISLIFLFGCGIKNTTHKIDFKEIENLNMRVLSFLNNNQLDSAGILIDEVLNLDSNNYVAYNNRAFLKFKLKKPSSQIIADYKKSLQINPNYDVAIYSLANYYFEIDDYLNTLAMCKEFIFGSMMNNFDTTFLKRIYEMRDESQWILDQANKIIDGVLVSAAIDYYDSINRPFNAGRSLQQRFIDKLTEAMYQYKNKGKESIDFKTLWKYLASAKLAGRNSLIEIQKITEIDRKINYKKIILDHVLLLNSMYDKEFKRYLLFLQGNNEEIIGLGSSVVLEKLKELKKAGIKLKETQVIFKNKYGFTRTI